MPDTSPEPASVGLSEPELRQALAALHEQLEFQRKRADDRVAAYERQAVELNDVRDALVEQKQALAALVAEMQALSKPPRNAVSGKRVRLWANQLAALLTHDG